MKLLQSRMKPTTKSMVKPTNFLGWQMRGFLFSPVLAPRTSYLAKPDKWVIYANHLLVTAELECPWSAPVSSALSFGRFFPLAFSPLFSLRKCCEDCVDNWPERGWTGAPWWVDKWEERGISLQLGAHSKNPSQCQGRRWSLFKSCFQRDFQVAQFSRTIPYTYRTSLQIKISCYLRKNLRWMHFLITTCVRGKYTH